VSILSALSQRLAAEHPVDLPNPSSPPSNGSWKIRTPKNPHSFSSGRSGKDELGRLGKFETSGRLSLRGSLPVAPVGEYSLPFRSWIVEALPWRRLKIRVSHFPRSSSRAETYLVRQD
jgi:hypothetical protein